MKTLLFIFVASLMNSVREGGRHAVAAAEDGPGATEAGTDGMTELQKHAAFFDRDHDGIITFDETYQGEPPVAASF